jgi:hypothetical protein
MNMSFILNMNIVTVNLITLDNLRHVPKNEFNSIY